MVICSGCSYQNAVLQLSEIKCFTVCPTFRKSSFITWYRAPQSATGLHDHLWDGASPNPVPEPQRFECFTCMRQEKLQNIHRQTLKWTITTAISYNFDIQSHQLVAKNRSVKDRRSLGGIASLILVVKCSTLPSKKSNSSAVIRSSSLNPLIIHLFGR